MGQKYAAYDSGNGNLLGFYDSIDSPVPAGLSAIEITESAWMNCLTSGSGWQVVNGALVELGETQEQTISRLNLDITTAISRVAEQWGYDSIGSAISYINSTNPQFAADAQALLTWRDQVWTWAIGAFDTVVPKTPSQDFLASMPAAPVKPTV